jgi:hypothetical protein
MTHPRKGGETMKKFTIRDAETVKTTAALYGCTGCPWRCIIGSIEG